MRTPLSALGYPWGAWVSPQGKATKVEFQAHYAEASALVAEHYPDLRGDYECILLERGWLKVRYVGPNVEIVGCRRAPKPTPAQTRALAEAARDAIEFCGGAVFVCRPAPEKCTDLVAYRRAMRQSSTVSSLD